MRLFDSVKCRLKRRKQGSDECGKLVDEVKQPSAFLKVKPGDKLDNGRYEVKSQLGAGRYSSVWLAIDSKLVYT